MTQKYDSKKTIEDLAAIYDAKKPTQAQFSKAVKDNLPKAQNADVDSFNEFLGIKEKHPAEKYQDRIEANIDKNFYRKQDSFTVSAVRREAAAYGSDELKVMIHLNRLEKGVNIEKLMIELNDKWELHFQTKYGEQNNGK